MNHNEAYAPQLSAYLDGELEEPARAELEAHLAVCGECRAELDALTALREALADETEYPAPEGFAAGVMERVRAEAAAAKRTKRAWRRWTGLAACAALVVLSAALLPNVLQHRNAAAPETAQYAAPSAASADGSAVTLYEDGQCPAASNGVWTEPEAPAVWTAPEAAEADTAAAAPAEATPAEAAPAETTPAPEPAAAGAGDEPGGAGTGSELPKAPDAMTAAPNGQDAAAAQSVDAELFTVRLYGETEKLTDFLLAHGAQQKRGDVFLMDGDLLRAALGELPEDVTLDEEDAGYLDRLYDDTLAMVVIRPEEAR